MTPSLVVRLSDGYASWTYEDVTLNAENMELEDPEGELLEAVAAAVDHGALKVVEGDLDHPSVVSYEAAQEARNNLSEEQRLLHRAVGQLEHVTEKLVAEGKHEAHALRMALVRAIDRVGSDSDLAERVGRDEETLAEELKAAEDLILSEVKR